MATRPRKQVHPAYGPERAFGDALREVRRSKTLSQEALGFDSDFDRTFISLLERGLKSPTVRTVFRLAEVLKVRPSELIRRAEVLLAENEPPRKSGR